MVQNEFQAIERYTGELEAVRHYRQLKEERESLVAEAAKLKKKVAELETQLKNQDSSIKSLSSHLVEKETEVRELTSHLDDLQQEVSSLRSFKLKLPDGGELTLEGMRDRFLRAEEDEIERRTRERLTALEKDIRRRMPTLVHKRLIQVLKQPSWPLEIAKVIDSTAKQIADSILSAKEKWPEWFKAYYFDEVNALVNQRLTTEFEGRAEEEAERRLEIMKRRQWQEYVASKLMTLAGSIRDLVKELQGPWWFHCDRCGQRLAVNLSPSDMGSLLRGKAIDVTCNTCQEPASFPFVLSTVQHKVASLTLEGLLELYVGSSPP